MKYTNEKRKEKKRIQTQRQRVIKVEGKKQRKNVERNKHKKMKR